MKKVLSVNYFQQAQQLVPADRHNDALAYLAKSLQANPGNHAALARLGALMMYESWMLPERIWNHDSDVLAMDFNPDRSRVMTATSNEVKIFDCLNGEPTGEPIKFTNLQDAMFSPNGERILALGNSGLQIFGSRSGTPLTKPIPRDQNAVLAGFILGGKCVVQFGYNNLRIWNSRSGEELKAPIFDPPIAMHQSFRHLSKDGKCVLCSAPDVWTIYDLQTGKQTAQSVEHYAPGVGAEFSADGNFVLTRAVVGLGMYMNEIWDAKTGKLIIRSTERHLLGDALMSPDQKNILSVSGGEAILHDIGTGMPVGQPWAFAEKGFVRARGDLERSNSLAFSPDGRLAALPNGSKGIRLWEVAKGKAFSEPFILGKIRDGGFSSGGKQLIVSVGTTVHSVSCQFSEAIPQILSFSNLNTVKFCPDGSRILIVTSNSMQMLNATSGKPESLLVNTHGQVDRIAFTFSGDKLLATTSDTEQVWNTHAGLTESQIISMTNTWHHAGLSPDGKKILAFSEATLDGSKPLFPFEEAPPLVYKAQLWDSQTGNPGLQIYNEKATPITYVPGYDYDGFSPFAEFSPDGACIVSLIDHKATFLDANTLEPLTKALPVPKHLAAAHLFSPNGKLILWHPMEFPYGHLTEAYFPQVWDTKSGSLVAVLKLHLSEFESHPDYAIVDPEKYSFKFSKDSCKVLAAFDDEIYAWDSQTGNFLSRVSLPAGKVSDFSSDGSQVLVLKPGRVMVLDVETGGELVEFSCETTVPGFVASFSPDGKRVMANSPHNIWLWDLPVNTTPPEWFLGLAEAVSGEKLDDQSVLTLTKIDRIKTIQEIRASLAVATDNDDWNKWGRWFLADPSTRAISPFSKMTVPEYIENRIKENTTNSLDEAETLAIGNKEVLARISAAREELGKAASPAKKTPVPAN